MITTKQRSYLRGLAMNLDPLMQVGKDAIKEESLKQIEEMLLARELVKIRVLNNCSEATKTIANKVANKIGCDIVQIIGRIFVIYKRSTREDVKHIELN